MRGSESYTPSTLVALRITSAPISTARSAAAVSVVKYGLPVPAARMTTRPFSRWRSARRRMYGSATSFIPIALMTRVWTPARSSASCRARPLGPRSQLLPERIPREPADADVLADRRDAVLDQLADRPLLVAERLVVQADL